MRILAILALAACADAPVPVVEEEPAEDGKEDAVGATLCDPLPAASKALCLQIPNNGWRTALRSELTAAYFEPLAIAVRDARARDTAAKIEDNVYPAEENMFAALRYVSPGRVKAVVVGQDPYIGVDQAIGLSFSVAPGLDVPPSLANIYAELVREADAGDVEFACPEDGDLRPWAKRGVFLLNAILTVQHGAAGSHKDFGWQQLTNAILRVARDRNAARPTVYLLWGSFARSAKQLVLEGGANPNILVLESNHPSPLATGFYGNGHFGKANAFLEDNGRAPIDWRLATSGGTGCTPR